MKKKTINNYDLSKDIREFESKHSNKVMKVNGRWKTEKELKGLKF